MRRIGLALLALVLGLYVFGNPLLDIIELKTYDLRLRAHPAAAHDSAVAIAAIDEKSLAAYGRWPWRRTVLAQLVTRLDTLGARVIAFDVFFAEPEDRASDAALANAIARSRKVVLPFVFFMSEDEGRQQSAAAARRAFATVEPQAIKLIRDRGDGKLDFPMPAAHGLLADLPELARAARASGHINSLPDRDGTVRWTPLVLRHHGLFFPSADVQAARLYLGDPPLTLHTAAYGIRGLQIGGHYLPTDEDGRALIHYRGAPRSFPTYSIADILAGRIAPGALRGRIVLIGATAQGLGDVRVTPFGAVFPGVEIRANVIQNLLDGDFIRRPGWMFTLDLAVMLALGGLLAWLLPRLGLRTSAALTVGLAAGYLLLAAVEFRAALVWLSVVYPVLLLLLLFVTATLVHYFSAEGERRAVKRAFQHYVPPAVVEQILRHPDRLGLGGEKRELSVLFCDIRGFTTLAEDLPPERLVQLLNDYLTRMTEQVFRHEGLLDKYIGDAILAVYGAPLALADHAKHACRTAVDMVREAQRLKAEWRAQGLPPLDIGVGINSGPVVVGNMGSKTRFDYTVIGDTVNLGSRIETLNKEYGTRILLSEFTWQQVKDEFPWTREIDVTTVRGRREPVRLYELLLAEHYPHMDWLKDYARAYELFRADLRVQARPVFERLARELDDPVSRYYAQRCQVPRRRRGD